MIQNVSLKMVFTQNKTKKSRAAKLEIIACQKNCVLVKEEKNKYTFDGNTYLFTRAYLFQGRAEYKLNLFLKLKMTLFSTMVLFSVETES